MDPEIEAMSKVADALGSVDETTQQRVIRWAAERFGVVISAGRKQQRDEERSPRGNGGDGAEIDADGPPSTFTSIADLFVAASPKTGPEKVLVAAYWLQVLQQGSDITSFAVNQELKNLGHAVNSINKVFDVLMEQKPQLAVQLKKGGTSKQARKRYKLTHAGIGKVESMIKSPKGEE